MTVITYFSEIALLGGFRKAATLTKVFYKYIVLNVNSITSISFNRNGLTGVFIPSMIKKYLKKHI